MPANLENSAVATGLEKLTSKVMLKILQARLQQYMNCELEHEHELCSFSLSIIPSTEHPGLISFRMDWLDLLAVQGISQTQKTNLWLPKG